MAIQYDECAITGREPPWCVDGRTDPQRILGPQMLGGSLHLVILWCLFNHKSLNKQTLRYVFQLLSVSGYPTGVHRGKNRDPQQNKSDCGFADNLPHILAVATECKDELLDKIYEIDHHVNKHEFDDVHNHLASYDRELIEIWGENLISAAEEAGASSENLEGDHEEGVAYINLQPGITLDNNLENKTHHQAFNMDIWAVRRQGIALHIPFHFVDISSVILFIATEKVLVEEKGKPALELVSHM